MSEGADETDRETQEARALRVVRELGATPTTVDRLGGVVNVVLRVVGDDVDWVVRSPVDPRRPDEFPVERWAVEAARTCGVPVPEVLHVGVSRGIPVMVSRYVQPAEPVARPWWWLGQHASSVAEADLTDAPDGVFSRFGRDLDHAWAAHLDYNQTALGPDDLLHHNPVPDAPLLLGHPPAEPPPAEPPLAEHVLADPLLTDGAYQPDDLPTLRRWLHDLDDLETSHGLVHGDLAPRNLVPQGADVAPVLLDWGSATTGPVPWTELQRSFQAVAVDRELPWSTLVDLADGMGVALDASVRRTLLRLTALRLLDLARWARDRRPDLHSSYRDACASGLTALIAYESSALLDASPGQVLTGADQLRDRSDPRQR